ncbi:MAG TPA: hypothetical protein DCE26_10235 [Dehalococcoidia bacterium]|nr:hypothetical protein [Chloroflexota bacterium]MQF94502.1 hypothetical protein [SAR202 cluster bacterium]HAA96048.1 hypothetical protein [Dehalococcoidia bacterium]
MSTVPIKARRVQVSDSFDAIQEYCWEQGWTDGLPVVPPTEPLVQAMLASYGGDPSQSLGVLQPRNSQATLEKIGINAVMAGCQPEHFPVVVAAVKAALDKDFNLGGNAATTGGAAQVLIVNGPIAKELGINGDAACFGPGHRANAAIGRALRLVIRNVAGLIPGDMDKATLATPGRYSFCFSENEDRSPWEARNITMGYPEGSSTVTITAIRGVYTIMESTSANGMDLLETFVGNMRAVGISNYYQTGTGAQIVMVICPEHADEIAAAGLTKAQVQEYIFQNARMPLHTLVGRAHYGNRNWPDWIDENDPDTMVPIVREANDIAVIVAGGDGRHSAWLAGWGVTRMKIEEITKHA